MLKKNQNQEKKKIKYSSNFLQNTKKLLYFNFLIMFCSIFIFTGKRTIASDKKRQSQNFETVQEQFSISRKRHMENIQYK